MHNIFKFFLTAFLLIIITCAQKTEKKGTIIPKDAVDAVIEKLNANSSKYSSNTDFLIKSKDELDKLKQKV